MRSLHMTRPDRARLDASYRSVLAKGAAQGRTENSVARTSNSQPSVLSLAACPASSLQPPASCSGAHLPAHDAPDFWRQELLHFDLPGYAAVLQAAVIARKHRAHRTLVDKPHARALLLELLHRCPHKSARHVVARHAAAAQADNLHRPLVAALERAHAASGRADRIRCLRGLPGVCPPRGTHPGVSARRNHARTAACRLVVRGRNVAQQGEVPLHEHVVCGVWVREKVVQTSKHNDHIRSPACEQPFRG
mmetsp:Transcript_3228/g.7834  ORF Transcript_3228/g.7834 Transcript_3228/m.7834 type:complete len:250 (-) Transcript_3228:1253-2002(-)